MDTLPAGKVEENAPNMELPVPNREVTLDSSPKQDDASEQPAAFVLQFALLRGPVRHVGNDAPEVFQAVCAGQHGVVAQVFRL